MSPSSTWPSAISLFTASGAQRPIRWLGHRTIDCRSHPLKAWPVRTARDAFEPGMPTRDLYVSPEHSLCVSVAKEEVLIPAEKLINGTTVALRADGYRDVLARRARQSRHPAGGRHAGGKLSGDGSEPSLLRGERRPRCATRRQGAQPRRFLSPLPRWRSRRPSGAGQTSGPRRAARPVPGRALQRVVPSSKSGNRAADERCSGAPASH